MLKLSKQEWFDAAWKRSAIQIRAQVPNSRSKSGFSCSYPALEDGTPGCFIGVVLKEHDLLGDEGVQGNLGASDLVWSEVIGLSDEEDDCEAADFLSDLQGIHDSAEPTFWREGLTSLALEHQLVIPAEGAP